MLFHSLTCPTFIYVYLPFFLQCYLFQELSTNEHISAQSEVSIYKYFLANEQVGQWRDGTIIPYDHELQRWHRNPQAVKFFILSDAYNEPATKLELYKNTDELVQSGGSRSCMTPIFTTYNPNLKKMIICFPYFSEFFSEWAADYKGDGSNCLPEILKDMIRFVHIHPEF